MVPDGSPPGVEITERRGLKTPAGRVGRRATGSGSIGPQPSIGRLKHPTGGGTEARVQAGSLASGNLRNGGEWGSLNLQFLMGQR